LVCLPDDLLYCGTEAFLDSYDLVIRPPKNEVWTGEEVEIKTNAQKNRFPSYPTRSISKKKVVLFSVIQVAASTILSIST